MHLAGAEVRQNHRGDEDPGEVVQALRKRASVDWGQEVLDRYGANAISVGWKVRSGAPTRHVSVRLYVPPGNKSRRRKGVDFVKNHFECGTNDAGRELVVPTDIAESTRPRLSGQPDPMAVYRRIPGGVSIGASGTAGTFGGWAWDRETQAPVILSAAHILSGKEGDPVMQPARLDRMHGRERVIGSLRRSTVVRPGLTNTVDAGSATIRDPARVSLRVLKIGRAIMATRGPSLDLPVEKFGKTSRYTRGTITDAFWYGWVELANGHWVIYTDCMRIVEEDLGIWAAPGDSGSIVFSRSALGDGSGVKPAIGLHFAADESDPRVGVACRIDNVFEALGLAAFPEGVLRQIAETLDPGVQRTMYSLVPDLVVELQKGPGGRELTSLFREHRVALVDALLRSQPVRELLGKAAGAVFAGTPNVESIVGAPVSRQTLGIVVEFLATLGDSSRGGIRRTCTSLLHRLRDGEGRTARHLLALADESVVDVLTNPSAADIESLYGAFVEESGPVLMERFGAVAVSVGRPPAGMEAPDGVVVKVFALPEQLEDVRRRVPLDLLWERPGRPVVRLRTAVVAARPVKKR